jgi:hypothetical protein
MRNFTIGLVVLGLVGGAFAWHRHASHPQEIAGLWTLWPDSKSDGDPVRFYFFHEDGIGLYRYGKIGLNTTNSFDWKVDGDDLVLTFRKTGEVVRTPFSVDKTTLTLAHDPKEPLAANVRYTFVPAPLDASAKVPGRLWIDRKKFATGGEQFSLYQLKDAAIDGRGVGWFHVGDFDDWSTEALTYRYTPTSMEFDFTVRGDHFTSKIIHDKDTLTFVEDPRGFWHVHSYKDAGPSFGQFDVVTASTGY